MAKDTRPIAEQTKDLVDAAIHKIIFFSQISLKKGLLAMLPELNKKKLEDRNNLFEQGLILVCNGTDAVVIEDILTNISNLKEPSYSQKILDALYILGALSIQEGLSRITLILKLDSRVPEKCRSTWLKNMVLETNNSLASEKGYPRVWLHPEEAETEFQKIASLSDQQIQQIMRSLDTEEIAWAVSGDDKMKSVFCHNMSDTYIESLETEISRIHEKRSLTAQERIVSIAQDLEFI